MKLFLQNVQVLEDNQYEKKGKKKRFVTLSEKVADREYNKVSFSADPFAPGLDDLPIQEPIPEMIIELEPRTFRADGRTNQYFVIQSVAVPAAKK